MKVMCMYLPQYHEIKENNEWWGEGFTEWTSVKRGKPLYKGHCQPKVPLNQNYYDLLKDGVNTWTWQAELAKHYDVYGFCIYHYWFKGEQLLERPMEVLLEHKEIPIKYSVCWANESWTRTWYDKADRILMEQEYGTKEDWEKHFCYLLQFFKDERYIKIDNKPLLHIYRTMDIDCLPEMLCCFNTMAKEEGFDGICVLSGNTAGVLESRKELIDGYYNFEPGYTLKHGLSVLQKKRYELSVLVKTIINKVTKSEMLERSIPVDWIFQGIINKEYRNNECPGIIPQWDNTPRRFYKGLVYKGATPEKFKNCLKALANKVRGRKLDMVYVNAWNEWGEGAILEPDEEYEYRYLEAVKEVVKESKG